MNLDTSDIIGTPAGQSCAAIMKKPALSMSSDLLMEQIVDPDNMQRAWNNVKANRGAPGPDGITLGEFPEYFGPLWSETRQQLLEGTYQPQPARRKSIAKPDGGERHLGIPNVQERVLQQAILQVLTPIFDPSFSESSFGFRPHRSAHFASPRRTSRSSKRKYPLSPHAIAAHRWGSDFKSFEATFGDG